MDKDLMIDLKDIVIHRDERKILSISTQIPRQGITAVIGPNGSGKTTLLKLLHGAIEADSGIYQPGWVELQSALVLHQAIIDISYRVSMKYFVSNKNVNVPK